MRKIDPARTIARVEWYEKMVVAFRSLSDAEREKLSEWEKQFQGQADISEWPGWEHYIGKKPDW